MTNKTNVQTAESLLARLEKQTFLVSSLQAKPIDKKRYVLFVELTDWFKKHDYNQLPTSEQLWSISLTRSDLQLFQQHAILPVTLVHAEIEKTVLIPSNFARPIPSAEEPPEKPEENQVERSIAKKNIIEALDKLDITQLNLLAEQIRTGVGVYYANMPSYRKITFTERHYEVHTENINNDSSSNIRCYSHAEVLTEIEDANCDANVYIDHINEINVYRVSVVDDEDDAE